jgi:hypothetical protein
MKNSVIAIPSSYVVITTILYALLYPIFLEMDNNALREGVNFVVANDQNDKTMTYSKQQQQQLIETECKSPCPQSAELCAFVCA